MQKIEIVKIESLSRAPMVVEGYLFEGSDPEAPSVAIVGAIEGDAIIPLYTTSRLVEFLSRKLEKEQKIRGNILVVPSVDHYALNVRERFWPLDKTDLNMMFPGYSEGETTQRIAHKLFEAVQGYTYGITLRSRPDNADCIPHVVLLESGYEDLEGAKRFGFKFIYHKEVQSVNTVSLQYNWQLWHTKAFTIMTPRNAEPAGYDSDTVFQALVRFLERSGVIDYPMFYAYESNVVTREEISVVKSPQSGIFVTQKTPGAYVHAGEVIGEISHALEGRTIHTFTAPCDGMITCLYNHALIIEKSIAFRIAQPAQRPDAHRH
ncbi:MAG TPA: succinylglutamate desuccinylase [Campylobacteraceae bacterium]|jgi:predicted deacylase|nr:succinylglutamate desuccinylase [Campylobacteraceae bacterium]HHD83241.1 succinylglutamate desuccinylase [Campylobacteraceae bacterium]